jgi:hypothetical protein
MAEVPIESRVDVIVALGTQPLSTVSFDSAAFAAELTDAAFALDYKVYTSLTEMVTDGFLTTSPAYLYAALCFGGKFRVKKVYVVKYGSVGVAVTKTPVQALTDLFNVDDTAYYVGCSSHSDANVSAIAAFAESLDKMYVHSTQQAGVLVTATTTDIASVLQDAAYDHVLTIYNAAADTAYAEGGVVGAMASITAGTSTLEDKTMTGVVVDSLNETQRTSLISKNVAYYMPIAGVNSVFNSKVASGQFFDTIVFADWLKANLAQEIYGLMKRESDLGRKVSYDEAGFSKIRQACRRVIEIGRASGSISLDIESIVRTPTRDEVSEADRMNRVLPNLVVEVPYSNAVHKVTVRAYVTV